jgi:hypothetical protein
LRRSGTPRTKDMLSYLPPKPHTHTHTHKSSVVRTRPTAPFVTPSHSQHASDLTILQGRRENGRQGAEEGAIEAVGMPNVRYVCDVCNAVFQNRLTAQAHESECKKHQFGAGGAGGGSGGGEVLFFNGKSMFIEVDTTNTKIFQKHESTETGSAQRRAETAGLSTHI